MHETEKGIGRSHSSTGRAYIHANGYVAQFVWTHPTTKGSSVLLNAAQPLQYLLLCVSTVRSRRHFKENDSFRRSQRSTLRLLANPSVTRMYIPVFYFSGLQHVKMSSVFKFQLDLMTRHHLDLL